MRCPPTSTVCRALLKQKALHSLGRAAHFTSSPSQAQQITISPVLHQGRKANLLKIFLRRRRVNPTPSSFKACTLRFQCHARQNTHSIKPPSQTTGKSTLIPNALANPPEPTGNAARPPPRPPHSPKNATTIATATQPILLRDHSPRGRQLPGSTAPSHRGIRKRCKPSAADDPPRRAKRLCRGV